MDDPITELAGTGLGSTDPGPLSSLNEAWSLEADECDLLTERYTWPSAWLRAALLALCAAVIAGAIGMIGWATGPQHRDTSIPATRGHRPWLAATPAFAPRIHPVPMPLAAPVPAPNTTAAPPTVRIDASPPAETEVPLPPPAPKLPPVPVFETSQDQWLLNNLRSLGYIIVNPPLVIANAHEACRLFQSGESPEQVNQQMAARMGTSMTGTLQLTSSAMLAYPNCY